MPKKIKIAKNKRLGIQWVLKKLAKLAPAKNAKMVPKKT